MKEQRTHQYRDLGRMSLQGNANHHVIADRYNWIDAARGIGISIVIFVHGLISLRDARLIPDDGLWEGVIYTIRTFAMPVFMVLAGLFVQRRLRRGIATFLRPLGTTVFWPYLVWGTLALIAEWLGRDIRNPVDTSPVDITLLWTPIAWLWFLWALALYHLVAAAIGRHPVILLTVSGIALLGDGLLSLPILEHQLAHYLIFYAFGVTFGPSMIGYILPSKLTACAAVLFLPLAWIAHAIDPDPLSLVATGAAVAGTIMVIGVSQSLRRSTMLLFLGRRSMPLYVCHIFFMTAARIVLARGLGVTEFSVLFPVCVTAAFCGPLLLLKLGERLNLVALMGFGRPILA